MAGQSLDVNCYTPTTTLCCAVLSVDKVTLFTAVKLEPPPFPWHNIYIFQLRISLIVCEHGFDIPHIPLSTLFVISKS